MGQIHFSSSEKQNKTVNERKWKKLFGKNGEDGKTQEKQGEKISRVGEVHWELACGTHC